MKTRERVGWWRFLVTFLVLLAVSCSDTQVNELPRATQRQANKTETATSSQMSPELRAAYIASVQKGASEEYASTARPGWVELVNPAMRFVTTVDAHGVSIQPNEAAWQWGLRATSIGCEGVMAALSDAEPKAEGNRVELRREGVAESYVNGPLGVEQAFVLDEAPKCTGPKVVTMEVGGDLSARLDDADGDGRGQAVRFVDDQEQPRLSYTDLFVTDAQGKTVPAWMTVDAGAVSLVVDDRGAAYPLAIDPLVWVWVQQQKLVASDGAAADWFGSSVSLSGDTALVGAYLDDDKGSDSGSAYVFVRNGTTWTLQQKLVASDGAADDWFGNSVSLSGDTALVGMPSDDNQKGTDAGSAYVFVRNGTTWTQQQKLIAGDGSVYDWFGNSVSLSGDTALVGAYADDDKGPSSGSTYVFVRNGTTWTQQQKLTASDGAVNDNFGNSVSLSGDTALVGSQYDDAPGMDSGSAYVFVRNGTTWTQQQKLVASDGAVADRFGYSVSLSGDTALVGSPFDDATGGVDAGSVYVFVRNGTTWTLQRKLIASNVLQYDQFGYSVSLSGDTALVGSPGDDNQKGGQAGSAYVFVRNGTTWTQQQKLVASDGAENDNFGYSVSLSGDTALAVAPFDDAPAADSGSAYVFVFVQRSSNGDACAAGTECASGFCVDGVCCNLACGSGAPGDCQACSLATGAAVDGTCSTLVAGTECRAVAGACDVAETCNGTLKTCPTDGFAVAGTECRVVAGICDVAESCDGAAAECPADAKVAAGTECRAVAGVCDVAESCDGALADCPADTKVASGTECRASAGVCDAAEQCDGAADECPADTKVAAGTECRVVAGACDAAEQCDGTADACPADAKVAAGTECRAVAGACDVAEQCDGTADECPADATSPDGTKCPEGVCFSGACQGLGGAGGAGGTGGGAGGAGDTGGGGAGGTGGTGESSSSSSGAGGSNPPDGGGCACHSTSPQPASSGALTLMGLALLVARRRRAKA